MLPESQTLVAKFFFSKSLVQMFFVQSYNASENITRTTSLPIVSENINKRFSDVFREIERDEALDFS